MSSMRNAVQRRNHKERAQPEGREKWGILEKHKDYSLRAADYNQKKAKLARLKEKVRDRNPDEFAFGMMSSSKGKAGKFGTRGNEGALSMDAAKLFKTQDAGYLRTVGGSIMKEIEKLEHGEGEVDLDEKGFLGKNNAKKVVYAEDEDEQRRLADKLDGIQEDSEGDDAKAGSEEEEAPKPKKSSYTLRKEEEEAARLLAETRAAKKAKRIAQQKREAKIEALKDRHAQIRAAEQELELQRAKMANQIGGTNKWGKKWKVRERKR